MIEDYRKACKRGRREVSDAVSHGRYPYLPVLDDILGNDAHGSGEVPIGVRDVPMELVVGTKTRARANTFSCGFLPIADEGSEFAAKWSRLYDAQISEGIRDPVVVYEYLQRFYVQEGNKRVSVLRSLDVPTITASITRVMPAPSEDPAIRCYHEFVRLYQVAPVYGLRFSQEGACEQLATLLGQSLDEPWPEDTVRALTSTFYRFTRSYRARGGDMLAQTVADAFEEARGNAKPATCQLGKQDIYGWYNNRITNEPADQEVTVVKFFDKATGEAFAGLVNWASHSATCGQAETRMNSEFAGMTSKKLEPSFGFFPAMIVGAAGDCSNRNLRQGTGVEEAERISSGIAPEIAAIPVETEVPLNGIRVQTVHHIVHNEKGEEVALCSVISLGGLHLFVSPCEFGGKFGIQMREACPVEGLVFGYTNGYLEYWLPEEEYGLSFETQKSMVPKGDPEILVGKLIQASQLLGR